ncbi:MAG TPA: hypothetical protein VMW10_08315 [Alphaproteobacteria bacterium]|nr:hypothetical protein [Alphaproteobacteria bacterium]
MHCVKYLDLSQESSSRKKRVLLAEIERSSIARKDVSEIYGKEAEKLVLLPSNHTVTIDPEHHFMVMKLAKGESLAGLVNHYLCYEELHDFEIILGNVGYALGELHYLPLKNENDEFFAGYGFNTHTHGDLTFPNIYYNKENEKTYLIDFEGYSKKGSCLFDLNFFLGCLSEHCKDIEEEDIKKDIKKGKLYQLRAAFLKGYASAFSHVSLEQKKNLIRNIVSHQGYTESYNELFEHLEK